MVNNDDIADDTLTDVDPQDDTTRQDATEPRQDATSTIGTDAEEPQNDAETMDDETGGNEDPQDDDTASDDPATLRAKLERRTAETIRLRKRAQAAEAELAALKEESLAWQRDRIAQAESIMGSVRADARADVLDRLDPQQIEALYDAARLSPERIRRAYQTHATRHYRNDWTGDSFGSALSQDPQDVAVRARVDAARSIIESAVGERQYLRASAVQTPDLSATLRRQNAITSPKVPQGDPLARALQRH